MCFEMNQVPEIIFNLLYEAFSKEPRPNEIDGCPCCVDAKEVGKLTSTPLREITPQELGGYASSVFLTVGSEADFRYYLPRILEVLATDVGWWPDPEVVGRAMANIPWEQWTQLQREALEAYFAAVFANLFAAPVPEGYEIDSWLCCSSHVLPEWERVLDRLTDHQKALVALYEWHGEPLQKQRLGNAFWDNSPKREVFLNWMLSDEVNEAKSVLMAKWGL